jgi:hypothetical protein
MVYYWGRRHGLSPIFRVFALAMTLVLPALSVAIPIMDRDLAVTDPTLASPDTPGRYFHDHQSICVPMEASQPLASGPVVARLPELPVRPLADCAIALTADAANRHRPRSRSPPLI